MSARCVRVEKQTHLVFSYFLHRPVGEIFLGFPSSVVLFFFGAFSSRINGSKSLVFVMTKGQVVVWGRGGRGRRVMG